MWQGFLMAVQVAVVALWLYADYDANLTDGRPAMALAMGIICAFGATQGLIGLKWLLTKAGSGKERIR